MRNRKRYPKDWRKRAAACKEAAAWRCAKCSVAHGTRLVSEWTGREWPVYLQAAHTNHDPENLDAELVAVCPRCHWRYFRRPGQRPAWMIEVMKHRQLLWSMLLEQ